MSIKPTHILTALETVVRTFAHKYDRRCKYLGDFDEVQQRIIRWGEQERNHYALNIALNIHELRTLHVSLATIIEAIDYDATCYFFKEGKAGQIGAASHYAYQCMQAYL